MYYITSNKKYAKKLASEIEKRTSRECEIVKDCNSWRVSNNTISGDFFNNVAAELGL